MCPAELLAHLVGLVLHQRVEVLHVQGQGLHAEQILGLPKEPRADSGPWNRICALPAFWVGLLYDETALDAAWDLVKDFTLAERHALRDGVPRHALALPFRGGTARDLAREAVKIAAEGLRRRARLDANGSDEARYLDPILAIAESGETAADRKLALYRDAWGGDIDRVFRAFAY